MGMLTLADFQDEIRAGLGNRNEISTTRITRVLNLAQSRISRSYDFSEMADVQFAQMSFTSNPALDKYLVPPDRTKTIHSFLCLDTSAGQSSLGSSRKVIEKPWRWFDQRFPSPEWLPPNWPAIYKRWGNVIVMVPAPQAQYTAQISRTRYPTPFIVGQSTQLSQFENKDDVLINYSLAYFFKTLGRMDRAIALETAAKELLDEAIEKDDDRPDLETSRDIPGLGGGGNLGPYWANPWISRNP